MPFKAGQTILESDFTGLILKYGGSLPSNCLLCDASAVSRSTYSLLFGVIGTTFGVGDGSTTFNLPDLSPPALTAAKGFWRFDESSGNASDSSGNSNTLTNNNTVTYGTGRIKNAATFVSASSQYFSILSGAQTGLNITSDISISLWLKFTTTGSYTILRKNTSTASGYLLQTTSTSITFSVNDGGQHNHTLNFTFADDTWYHFVVTWTAATPKARFYMNGVFVGSSTTAGTLSGGATTLNIGFDGSVNYFNGTMDDLAIWNRVLTINEVEQMYQNRGEITFIVTSV